MADTTTATVPQELLSMTAAEAEVQLPALATETVAKAGDLISRKDFTGPQNAAVAEAVNRFDLSKTSDTLRFGAATQQRASSYLDELIGDMTVGEAGVAGEILTEITTGVSMMKLAKVRDQLKNPPGWLAKLMGYTDYLRAFIDSHRSVVGKFDKIELKARNLMATLSGKSDKLDRLVVSTETQINELRVLIAVGEDILVKANAEYAEERTAVLAEQPLDTLKLQKLLDKLRSIRAFEVRLLRIQTAYTKLSTTAIPAIRRVQEAIKIEIQNIDEAILFDMTDFKMAVMQLGALKNLQDAQAARKGYDKALEDIQDVLADTTADVTEAALASQGDALARAEKLQEYTAKMIAGAQKAMEADEKSAEDRKAAYQVLLETKGEWDAAAAEMAATAV